MNRPQTGFTLIEIMIAVAIIGLLSAIAYPIYRDSIYKGARAEGRAALMDLLQQQERYASQNGRYFAFAKNASSTPFKTYSGENGSGKAKYLLYAETCSSDISIRDCVKLTAEPVQADTVVGKLSLQSTGVKSCDGSAATTPPPTICWP